MDLRSFRSLTEGQMPTVEQTAMTVTELNQYISSLFAGDARLQNICLRGEITNFKAHSSGHLYFSLKDENALIRAVMFRSQAARLRFALETGMKVVARGSVAVYMRDGQYQLYVNSVLPDGIGELYLAFEQRKKRLQEEGLFDESRKRPLPRFPRAIGVITSPTGAAVRDIIQILGRRYPRAKTVLYPALVQGTEAPASLIKALRRFNEQKNVDVLIIGRGGGSMEDLFAFNDESLVREVAASAIPVISAVGHETDFTLCDFAADRRAPTPSAAAELAVPDSTELSARLLRTELRMRSSLAAAVRQKRRSLALLSSRPVLRDPVRLLDEKKMRTITLSERLRRSVDLRVGVCRSALQKTAASLDALSPLAVLSRGYGIATDQEKRVLYSCADIREGDRFTLHLQDGRIVAQTEEIYSNEEKREVIS